MFNYIGSRLSKVDVLSVIKLELDSAVAALAPRFCDQC